MTDEQNLARVWVDGREAGKAMEREKIVRWLRRWRAETIEVENTGLIGWAADRLEETPLGQYPFEE